MARSGLARCTLMMPGVLAQRAGWMGLGKSHASPLGMVWLRRYADNSDGNEESPGLMKKIWALGQKSAKSDKPDANASESNDTSENALIVSGPERKHHKVYVVELGRKPLFPGIYTPVMVTKNEKLIKEITESKKQGAQAYVGAFLRVPESAAKDAAAKEVKDAKKTDAASHLYEIGTFAQVHTILTGDTADSAQLLLLGHRRIRRTGLISSDPLKVHIEHLRDEAYNNDDILKATSMEIVNTMRDLLHLNPLYGEQFRTLLSLTGSIDLQDMSRLVDAAASLTSADDITLQGVLEQLNVPERAKGVLLLLKKEVELCKLQADIREQVESKIMKEQRRTLLMEQLKSIKKELGLEKDDKSALVQRFQERWEPKKASAPEEARRVVQDELDKLAHLEPVSPEFNVTRNYLEWLTSLPWGSYTNEIFDVEHAKKVLDDDHYGLDDVKERILEFIAVSRLRGSAHGKILCLVGPPGVGKTSIGRSIAHTLNRKYYRFSVGGLYDVAEIKGHRRTYVGAMPGKMVQCLKSTGSSNPLVLIDEIDKLGRGHTGDPASALLELLDPEQNASFMDHYLDVPVDLSKVLFVCTANVLDTIPGPLLDRMEVIRLSGYAADEKRAIARRYLEPQAASDSGVPSGAAQLDEDAMDMLINEYCREAGVRNLKKHLEKIYRKVALKLVKSDHITVAPAPDGDTSAAAVTTSSNSSTSSSSSSSKEQQQQPEPGATTSSSSEPSTPTTASVDSSSRSESISSSTSSSSSSNGEDVASKHPASPSSVDSTADRQQGEASSTDKPKQEPVKVVYKGDPIVINKDTLKDYVGGPSFAKDRFYDVTPPGVVMGLAWTAMGGATLYVEAAKVQDTEAKGAMQTTGQLGDVFKESATIAHTFARAFLAEKDPANKFFATSAIHVHVPAGATPKDGPSAGCTIITALLSLALNKPVMPDLAMTGEVTLTGRVLPIGGVKEKLLAARRSGVNQVIFPEANKKDYDELAQDLKEGIVPHFVSTYQQVFELALLYDGPLQPTKPTPELSTPVTAVAATT